MNLFHDLERRIDQKLRKLFQSERSPAQPRELVEVERIVLDAIDGRVQTLPRARRVFPFNDVVVRIPVPDAERRGIYQMVFVDDGALENEVREHLRRDGVEFPADLTLNISLLETEELSEPALICRNRAKAEASATPQGVNGIAVFTLPSGQTVELSKQRIHVGRLAEVLDERGRVVRRNDLVFDDKTVSRAHARIERNEGGYRLYDDGSSYGTSVVHQGRLVEAPKAGARGLRLEPGDEIYFGKSLVRFDVKSE